MSGRDHARPAAAEPQSQQGRGCRRRRASRLEAGVPARAGRRPTARSTSSGTGRCWSGRDVRTLQARLPTSTGHRGASATLSAGNLDAAATRPQACRTERDRGGQARPSAGAGAGRLDTLLGLPRGSARPGPPEPIGAGPVVAHRTGGGGAFAGHPRVTTACAGLGVPRRPVRRPAARPGRERRPGRSAASLRGRAVAGLRREGVRPPIRVWRGAAPDVGWAPPPCTGWPPVPFPRLLAAAGAASGTGAAWRSARPLRGRLRC